MSQHGTVRISAPRINVALASEDIDASGDGLPAEGAVLRTALPTALTAHLHAALTAMHLDAFGSMPGG
jgi:hypothetical protein